jgi:3-deoxy-manno-octulosonate cytidylyltransferase (CMP-KDO synthetase)
MHTVAIIPARYASERLPGKPLVDIGGKPMIQHVYERTALAKQVHRVIVATDDERIATTVRGFGGEALMTPFSLKSGSDRIAYVARSLNNADIIVNVQGDEPLIVPDMIDQAVVPLREDHTLVAGTLVRKIRTENELLNPSIPKVVLDKNGFCLYFSRSPIPFVRDHARAQWMVEGEFYKHIGLYVYQREFLLTYSTLPQTPLELLEKLEQLRILEHGYRIKAVVTSYDTTPVDTPDDLEKVRVLITGTP